MRVGVRALLIVLLAATLASAFSTTLAYQAESARGDVPDTWRLALLNTSFWYGWVVLAYPLVLLTRRVRIDRSPRYAIPIHITAVALAAIAHIALQTTAQTLGYRGSNLPPEMLASFSWTKTWLTYFPLQLTQIIDWEIVAASAIVGIAHASFYYAEAQKHALHEAQLETRLVEAQLKTLQHQLHPHFLFNTLHAISALMHRDVQAADRMLVELSDLLRLTLDSVSRPEIRLNDELEFLEKYVHIEQVRLGDRLTVEFDVDVDVLDAVVPALILQPLVENAVKHGIAPLGTAGRVRIGARREGETLLMTIDDTGPGPSERAMAAMSMGIGVSNTRARLGHQFGNRFRFEFQRHAGGFTVLVAIPFRQDTTGSGTAAAYVA